MTDFSSMEWLSRFVYGVEGGEVEWITTIPVMPWDRWQGTEGGSAISAAGIPASFVIREDHVLVLTLRIMESEWVDLLELVTWGQGSEEILWYPDAAVGDSYLVYLHSPPAGERFEPIRADFPGLMEVTIELRRVDGGVWPLEFFGADS